MIYQGDRFPAWKGNLFVGSGRRGEIPFTGGLERVVLGDEPGRAAPRDAADRAAPARARLRRRARRADLRADRRQRERGAADRAGARREPRLPTLTTASCRRSTSQSTAVAHAPRVRRRRAVRIGQVHRLHDPRAAAGFGGEARVQPRVRRVGSAEQRAARRRRRARPLEARPARRKLGLGRHAAAARPLLGLGDTAGIDVHAERRAPCVPRDDNPPFRAPSPTRPTGGCRRGPPGATRRGSLRPRRVATASTSSARIAARRAARSTVIR